MNLKQKITTLSITLLCVFSVFASRSDFSLVRDTEILINMLRTLNESYVDSLSTSQLLRDGVAGMGRGLDPYTTYIDEEAMGDFEIMTTGKYGGIGSVIRQDDDYVLIAQPYKGSPADKAGLMIGDKILRIDKTDAKGMTTKDVSDRLKGVPGSKVKVVIASVLDSTEREVTIKRERISIPAVSYSGMLEDGVGYLKHSDFTEGGYEQMRAALEELESEGMRSLVLDYRNNGGGIMQEAIKVLSLFVPKGSEVLKIKGRRDSTIYKTTRDPHFVDLPMVVLVNGNSASAAEIVSGALQDMDRAVLIGQKTFGKGLVQSTVPVGYDSYLKLTTARYYIPSGRCIQAVDYSDHGDERKIKVVADSLRKEFRTAGGRVVRDGGGITPDIEVDTEYVSRFATALYLQGFMEEWGEEYFRRHYAEGIEVDGFSITDEYFESFKEIMKGRKVEYKSQTARAIEQLERAAKDDRNTELMEEIERLKGVAQDDTEANIERYREEIIESLNQDIILRFAYSEGVIRHSLANDPDLKAARELLSNQSKMNSILQGAE